MAHAIYSSFLNLIDSNGVPLTSARAFVLDAGTTTLKTIYSDSGLSIEASNPIAVSLGGPHAIRYVAAGTYKIQVETGGTDTLNSGTVLTRYSKDNVDTGVAVGSGALPVASGGTAATTAASARTSLAAASSSDLASVAADVAELQGELTGTDATQIAAGTTAQRPAVPADGQIRRNTTLTQFEGYDGAAAAYRALLASGTQTEIEAAASTALGIAIGNLKYHPLVPKAWALITYSGGTPTLAASSGISSITDTGTGICTLTMSSAQSGTSYAVQVTPQNAAVASSNLWSVDVPSAGKSVNSFQVRLYSAASSGSTVATLTDFDFACVVYGDL